MLKFTENSQFVYYGLIYKNAREHHLQCEAIFIDGPFCGVMYIRTSVTFAACSARKMARSHRKKLTISKLEIGLNKRYQEIISTLYSLALSVARTKKENKKRCVHTAQFPLK